MKALMARIYQEPEFQLSPAAEEAWRQLSNMPREQLSKTQAELLGKLTLLRSNLAMHAEAWHLWLRSQLTVIEGGKTR
jgi:hypothetical protein